MGGTTNTWFLRYPYQSETVTPTHFQNLADDIDAALDELDGDASLVLNRPFMKLRQETNQTGISSGTAQVVTWDTEDYDPANWWSAGSPTLITLPPGIYTVQVGMDQITGATGVDEHNLDIQLPSGTTWSRKTTTFNAGSTGHIGHSALVYTATTQSLRLGWSFYATSGTGTNSHSSIWVRQVVPL